MFSTRVPHDLAANRLTIAVAAQRAAGRSLIDLTESNPTRAGFDYPADLLAPLADARALAYAPSPLGLREAREAVSRDFARQRLPRPAARRPLPARASHSPPPLVSLLRDA